MTREEIKNNLDLLFSKKEVIEIIKKINNNYHRMSLKERKDILFDFSELASETLESYVYTCVNNDTEGDHEFSDVVLSNYNDGIAINGVDKNPYIYLKDILFYHLVASHELENETICIGDVNFSCDYTSVQPFIASYNTTNLMFRELIISKLNKVLKDIDNPYKRDFDLSLDNNLTNEMKKEFSDVYEALDKFNKLDTYDKVVKIRKIIDDKLIDKHVVDKRYLYLFGIDNILRECLQAENKEILKDNLKSYVMEFFPEFANYINIEINKSTIKINDIKLRSDDMFMDLLLFSIENLDRKYNKIEYLVSDEKLEEMQQKLNKTLSKRECYFYTKLANIDSLLENRDLEIVNYAKYTDIIKLSSDDDIYIDKDRIFEDLFHNEDFTQVCNDIVTSKKIDKKIVTKLEKVLTFMNDVYFKAPFKLVTSFNMNVNSELGSSDNDTIYLNLANLNAGIDVLNTFFHEYRHLVQARETKENNGIYNDRLYEYVKKQYIESPFSSTYGYCTYAEAGYRADINYDLQPIEFDAENFAKYMLVSLSRLEDSEIKVRDSLFNSKYAKKYKWFSNKKISLKYYDYYLELYKVEETVAKDEEDYKVLIEKLSHIEELKPEDLFKTTNFDELEFIYKKEVYKKILLDKQALKIVNDKTISINGKVLSIDDILEYELLEELLLNNALYLAKQGEISISGINDYVYREALKYKIDTSKLDCSNLYRIYLFHNTFNKYRVKTIKNKVKSK